MTQKIIIDTDPGIDDTMAITFALRSPELEVVGLTSVFGNADIETTTQNALRLVELEGHGHIPVARGSGVPLVLPPMELGTDVHGMDGMGNTNPPPPAGKPLGIPAAQFIVETVMANPGEITLVPVGPLTNIALALLLEPRIAGLVRGVAIMGGAATVGGNISPTAEANIYHDPHAAETVFAAGWPLVMVGLDVTTKVIMEPGFLKEVCASDNPAARLIGRILPCYQSYFDMFYGTHGQIHTHDPSAVAYLVDPDLFETHDWPVYVGLDGRGMGQTIADPRRKWGAGRPAVKVCTGVNADGVLKLFKERLTRP